MPSGIARYRTWALFAVVDWSVMQWCEGCSADDTREDFNLDYKRLLFLTLLFIKCFSCLITYWEISLTLAKVNNANIANLRSRVFACIFIVCEWHGNALSSALIRSWNREKSKSLVSRLLKSVFVHFNNGNVEVSPPSLRSEFDVSCWALHFFFFYLKWKIDVWT